DDVSAALAAHYEQAGERAQAVHFYRRAGRVAAAVLAHDEAVRLLREALNALDAGPSGPERNRIELGLQSDLSASLTVLQGYASPELEASLERMQRLGEALQEPQAVVRSLHGLLSVHFVRGDIAGAHAAAEQSLAMAEGEAERALLADSHFFLAGMLFTLGRPAEARAHFDEARALADVERLHATVLGTNLLVFSQSWEAHALWALGDQAAAGARTAAALALADRLEHPHSQALAHAYAALVAQMLGRFDAAWLHAEAARSLCSRYGIAYYGEWGTIIRGWVQAKRDRLASGIDEIRLGLENLRVQRAEVRRPYYLALLAEAYLAHDRPEEAGATLDAALSTANQRRELWWLPELHRLRSRTVPAGERADRLRLALRLADEQGSVALAQRAARDLARLT
ncbi:MAG TPA: SARP family transcriptional regulator, partial [Limnochordia bacterium]|nr:SARP family transcriptional regulator [Limnochordia bacterium]